MAIQLRDRGTIGCAYFVASRETLFFMDDVKAGGKEIIETLKLQINPTVILICSCTEDDIMDCLTSGAIDEDGLEWSNNGIGLPYLLELRPKSEFDYDSAVSKLVQLNVGAQDGPHVVFSVPGDVHGTVRAQGIDDDAQGSQAALLRLSGWIQTESQVTVGCAGAVVSYIQRRRLARFLPTDPAAQAYFRLAVIEMFSLRDMMLINADTMLSLQIFQSEHHPHRHRQGPAGSGSKEGLSIFGLFVPLARTPQGKRMLRQYFLRPILNQQIIQDRLEAVSIFTRPCNFEFVQNMIKSLKKIKDIRTLLLRLRGGISGGTGKSGGFARSIWIGIRDFSLHALNAFGYLQDVVAVQRLPIFVAMRTFFDTAELAAIGTMVEQTVDFEESILQHRTCVRPHIDEELDAQKRFYDGVSDLLSQVAQEITKRIPGTGRTELSVIYYPQIGFLVAMPIDPVNGSASLEGNEEDHWERMFSTEALMYYKNDQMREMDERFGDLYVDICDREIELVQELAERVLQREELLAKASDLCGELDCLLALAQAAEQFKLVRPQISEDNNIRIKGGRHMLQELTVPTFIANDAVLVGRAEDMCADGQIEVPEVGANTLVISGPNYSGKSVYMKQVALIVYLAHIGSFVPAESAHIGLTDKILTRISTRESVSQSQSAFKIDLDQVCRALKVSTRRSLLIIDEFGKGTNSNDGAGLACAVLEHLLRTDIETPKTLLATHFHEIFENGYVPMQPGLQFLHMDVLIDHEASDAADQVVYIYSLREGRSTESFGTICAAINGVSAEVVERAEQLVLMCARGEDLVVACAIMPEAEAESLTEAVSQSNMTTLISLTEISQEALARRFLASNLAEQPRQLLGELLVD